MAAYFITLNVQEREHLFGKIIDGNMVLNPFGRIVEKIWNDIPERYPGVCIDAFVVMPDHVHGIIMIDRDGRTIVGGIHVPKA